MVYGQRLTELQIRAPARTAAHPAAAHRPAISAQTSTISAAAAVGVTNVRTFTIGVVDSAARPQSVHSSKLVKKAHQAPPRPCLIPPYKGLAATPQQALHLSTFTLRAGAWAFPARNGTTAQEQQAGIWVLRIVLLQPNKTTGLAATPQQALQSSTFAQRAGAWVLPLRNVTTVQGQPAGIWVLKIVLLQSSKNTKKAYDGVSLGRAGCQGNFKPACFECRAWTTVIQLTYLTPAMSVPPVANLSRLGPFALLGGGQRLVA
ncbi:hypothetical protein WJX79_001743 [Trebouxia sp. C0005]